MKKALLYIIGMAAAMTSCVSYEAEDFTGHTLPRKTGYSTGVTNDWLYFDLKTGHRYNVLNPNQSVIAFIDGKPIEEYFHYKGTAKLVKYWSEGVQKNIFEDAERDENGDTIFTKNQATGKLTYKTVKRQANSILVMENQEDDPKTMAYPATEWDLAFDGYQLRTNSGTSGIGKGGAADLGYGEYDKWTSKA